MEKSEQMEESPPARSSFSNSDPEKGVVVTESTSVPSTAPPPAIAVPNAFKRFNDRIESLAGLEARGITRVEPNERHDASVFHLVQMALLWFSANLTANNLAVGFLGPLLFGLGFVDSAMAAVFGALVGSLFTAYMSTWGAASGNRTMIVARFFMGYWPSKIAALLNIVLMIGYGMIDCVIAGQMLSAVSGGSMSIVVGIIIVALISWVIAVFGMAVFHHYERWAFLPQLIVLFILVGSAGPKFDSTLLSVGDDITIAANRLTFFSIALSVPVSWAAASSDFYVYYPQDIAKWKIFLMTFMGLFLSFAFVNMMGVGLASGMASDPGWTEAYGVSSGALILAGYDGLGGFGKFCGVIVAFGVIANNIPGTYSAALGFQMLGRYPKMVPRYLWTCVVVIVYFVCAIAGRDNLFIIFQNFLALMGYWIVIFVSIVLEEHVLFKWNIGFEWDAWEDKSRLPIGIAALIAFLIGWGGAIIGMDQVYFVGPLAKLTGEFGADMGMWLGMAFTLLVFPPLRWAELKFIGR